MYSLDTVNGIFKGHRVITARVRAVPLSDLWVSTIVVEELVGKQISHINTLRSHKKPVGRECQFLAKLVQSLAAFPLLPYTDEAEDQYRAWTARQKRVGPNDCRIAAGAITAGLVVVTCNKKDFSTIPGLAWQDWSQP